ncbi:hypothetical protein [Nocardia arizonensis]|uniref:hypothetical protein n=1 Tax=Nocardia arizonensis TaxID=1141647 RepID=UPI0006D07344|nr:hypothetical protein [Nocardia arizonensis]
MTGADRQDAIRALTTEVDRRMQDPTYGAAAVGRVDVRTRGCCGRGPGAVAAVREALLAFADLQKPEFVDQADGTRAMSGE